MQEIRSKSIEELENELRGKYLTEENLGKILKVIYPNFEWLRDKKFEATEGIKYNFRPDYCCHALKMCVEFDGPDHFTKANIIQADFNKDEVLKELGYKVIRIPYFIQLDTEGIRYFFNLSVEFNYDFKHGFISRGVTLPANFCEQGIWKFKSIMYELEIAEENGVVNIFSQIKESLLNKIRALKLSEDIAIITVIPSLLLENFGLSNNNYENKNSFNDLIQNSNVLNSNLKNAWNCVILESAQSFVQQEGVYDVIYTYNTEGNLSGYSFKMLYKGKVHEQYVLIEKDLEDEDVVSVSIYANGNLISKKYEEAVNVNVFSITDLIFLVK